MGEILHKTFLENWTDTDTHTHTDPRTTRNPVSQHYRVGLENTEPSEERVECNNTILDRQTFIIMFWGKLV